MVDRAPLEPPPVIVAVVGGPKVGKSTLLRCLIKNYTNQRLSEINGPVTIVAGGVSLPLWLLEWFDILNFGWTENFHDKYSLKFLFLLLYSYVSFPTGKKKKLTFIEVNNDVNCMIDIAKVADIVLILIDATFGIEMEVFEFLEICRAHGSPRIMGVNMLLNF